jgi:antitoxin component of MazEF toxin-antitoxin module
VLSSEENCNFVDHQQAFYLRLGEINKGFLNGDKIHPNLLRTNHIAKALDLKSKNRVKYDVATRKTRKSPNKSKKLPVTSQNDSTNEMTDDNFEKKFWTNARNKSEYQTIQPDEKYMKNQSSKRCGYCAEFNHVTRECGFRKAVQCRQCLYQGHKQKFCYEFSTH